MSIRRSKRRNNRRRNQRKKSILDSSFISDVKYEPSPDQQKQIIEYHQRDDILVVHRIYRSFIDRIQSTSSSLYNGTVGAMQCACTPLFWMSSSILSLSRVPSRVGRYFLSPTIKQQYQSDDLIIAKLEKRVKNLEHHMKRLQMKYQKKNKKNPLESDPEEWNSEDLSNYSEATISNSNQKIPPPPLPLLMAPPPPPLPSAATSTRKRTTTATTTINSTPNHKKSSTSSGISVDQLKSVTLKKISTTLDNNNHNNTHDYSPRTRRKMNKNNSNMLLSSLSPMNAAKLQNKRANASMSISLEDISNVKLRKVGTNQKSNSSSNQENENPNSIQDTLSNSSSFKIPLLFMKRSGTNNTNSNSNRISPSNRLVIQLRRVNKSPGGTPIKSTLRNSDSIATATATACDNNTVTVLTDATPTTPISIHKKANSRMVSPITPLIV